MKRLHRLFALLTFGPVVIWLICILAAIALSGILGCRIDESAVHPCVILGREIGAIAATFGHYAAWGPLIVGPISLGFGLMWIATVLIVRVFRKH